MKTRYSPLYSPKQVDKFMIYDQEMKYVRLSEYEHLWEYVQRVLNEVNNN